MTSPLSPLLPPQRATLTAYAAAISLLPTPLRPSSILLGGGATITHAIPARITKDVDILVSTPVLSILSTAIDTDTGGFHRDSDGEVKWGYCGADGDGDGDGVYEFDIRVELVLLGVPFNPRVPEVVPLGEGFVVRLPEPVRLGAETLAGGGGEGLWGGWCGRWGC